MAPYAFTTLNPSIGQLKLANRDSLRLADIPGLIEGASENKGLGLKFLKHVERSKVLLFLLDGSIDPADKNSPLRTLKVLRKELKNYSESLENKPFLVVLNKSDTKGAFSANKTQLEGYFDQVHCISAKEGLGLEPLVKAIVTEYDKV